MAVCCSNCFHENIIKEYIFEYGTIYSECSFCKRDNIPAIEPKELFQFIERFSSSLKEDENGQALPHVLKHEFRFFNKSIDNYEFLFDLIIKENDYLIGKKYAVSDSSESIENWKCFKNELILNNRFFPQTPIYKEIFCDPALDLPDNDSGIFYTLIETLKVSMSSGKKLYRARISEDLLKLDQMGKPPSANVTAGRANPVGIPYLYLAEDIDTCVAEVRPSNGAKTCVALFELSQDVKLIDITEPRMIASFLLVEGNFEKALEYIALLEAFASELSSPVLPERSHIDYIPTQFICEFFKTICKFDGIIFKSSFTAKKNVVLFNDEGIIVKSVDHYKISNVTQTFEKI